VIVVVLFCILIIILFLEMASYDNGKESVHDEVNKDIEAGTGFGENTREVEDSSNPETQPTIPIKDDSNASAFDKYFEITKRGSKLSTEIIAGVTTFLSMAYILAINSGLLSGPLIKYGPEVVSWGWNSVFIATCFASAISTFIMAFVPNVPFALAPGMGLNAQVMLYMYGLMGPEYTFGGAMTIVFVSGILFLIITLVGFREFLFDGIPDSVKSAISVGIGLFIAFIGMQNGMKKNYFW
jgi:AGZA family xanthine/uracil permease-like MFS transporter